MVCWERHGRRLMSSVVVVSRKRCAGGQIPSMSVQTQQDNVFPILPGFERKDLALGAYGSILS